MANAFPKKGEEPSPVSTYLPLTSVAKRSSPQAPEDRVAASTLPVFAWQLDGDRTDLWPELSSLSCLGDFLWFAFWFLAGFVPPKWILDWLESVHVPVGYIALSCMFCSLAGIIGASNVRKWWILGLGTGAATMLVERDLEARHAWHQENCRDLNVGLSYSWNQKTVLFCAPFAALWFVVTSEALDRTYKVAKRCRFSGAYAKHADGCMEGLCGHAEHNHNRSVDSFRGCLDFFFGVPKMMRRDSLTVFLNDLKHQEPQTFFGTFGASDRSLPSSPRSESSQECQVSSVCSTVFDFGPGEPDDDEDEEAGLRGGETVMLIFNSDGGHVLGRMKKEGTWELMPGQDQQDLAHYQQVLTAVDFKRDMLLFIPKGTNSHPYLLSTDSNMHQSVGKTQLAICMLIPMLLWFLFAIFGKFMLGQEERGNILFLVLPEVVEVFFHSEYNQTFAMQIPIQFNGTAMTQTISSGLDCVAGKDGESMMRTQVALFTSTFFFMGCQGILLLACYHLHTAFRSLYELNDLLLLYNQPDADSQVVLLHKLHKIRESIHNKRCLQHFAPHAFPQELKPDTRLIWYFQTRAAIFADIRFNLQKRNVILLLCFSLSMILSLLALLAVNLRWTAQRSSILCYGFAHGVASALILVLYIVFGSRVNGELDRGIETLQALYFNVEEGQDDSPKTPKKIKKPSHTDGIVSPLPSDPTPDQVCRYFLQYLGKKPYNLKFLCFSLTLSLLSVPATPLITFATTMVLCFFRHFGFDFSPSET